MLTFANLRLTFVSSSSLQQISPVDVHRLGLKGSWPGCWPESPSYLLYQLPPTSAQRPFSPVYTHTHTVCTSMLLYTCNIGRGIIFISIQYWYGVWADYENRIKVFLPNTKRFSLGQSLLSWPCLDSLMII